jgi:hypothetical protein
MDQDRSIFYLKTFEDEGEFIDYLHELMRDENPVRAATAKEIYCRFTGRTVEEYDNKTKKMDRLVEVMRQVWS